MKRFFLFLYLFSYFCIGKISAQLNGQFLQGQDGHVYFQATNIYGTYFNATVIAISEYNERKNSEMITVGQGFILGPSTPWRWYWVQGDRIYVTYPNGQQVFWECPYTDAAYNISFGGGYYSPTNNYVNIQSETGAKKGQYKVYLNDGKKYINFYDTWICIQGKQRFHFSGNWYIIN